jgi:hypothetical protein
MSSRKRPAGADEGPKRSDLDRQVEPLLATIVRHLRGKGFSRLPQGGFAVFEIIERRCGELTDKSNQNRMSHYIAVKTAIQELARRHRVTVRPITNEDIATICAALAARNRSVGQHVSELYDHIQSHRHTTQQQRADDEKQSTQTCEILKKEYDEELKAMLPASNPSGGSAS